MLVELTLDNGIFIREVPDQYYETLRDLLLVSERHTFVVNEVKE